MIYLVIYLAGFSLSVLPMARAFAGWIESEYGDPPSTEDYLMATALGFAFGAMWPLVLLCVPFYRALRKPAPVSMEKR